MSDLRLSENLLQELEQVAENLDDPSSESQIRTARRVESDVVNHLGPSMEKLRKRIAEKDPNKQTFGPKTIQRIKGILQRFDALVNRLAADFGLTFQVSQDSQTVLELAAEQVASRKEKQEILTLIEQGKGETLREEEERQKRFEDCQKALAAQRSEAKALTQEERLQTDYIQKLMQEAQAQEDAAARSAACENLCLEGLTEYFLTLRTDSPAQLAPLADLLHRIKSNPEDASLRFLRLLGGRFQRDIGSTPGALKVLRAAGFRIESAKKVGGTLQRCRLVDAQKRMRQPTFGWRKLFLGPRLKFARLGALAAKVAETP